MNEDRLGIPVQALMLGIALIGAVLLTTATAKAAEPVATTLNALQVGDDSARLRAAIDTGGESTRYQFEYGTDTGYGTAAPLNPAVAGLEGTVTVSRLITGLQPNTTYHFRVVATNASGASEGDDIIFTTGASGEAGRVYEQVSPPDKQGVPIAWGDNTNPRNLRTTDGSAVTFGASGAFAGAQASLLTTTYLAERGEHNWNSKAVSVPQAFVGAVSTGDVLAISDDLSASVVFTKQVLTPDSPPGLYHVYLQRHATGELTRLFSSSTAIGGQATANMVSVGGTPSFDHVVFTTPEALTPDAPVGSTTKLYEHTNGETRLVSMLPDGDSDPSNDVPAPHYVVTRFSDLSDVISDDGSRIFFTLGTSQNDGNGTHGTYVRIDGKRTVPMSASQRPGDPGTVLPAVFRAASDDGDSAYITSRNPLTVDASEGPWDTARDGVLYRFSTSTEELEAVTPGPEDPMVSGQSVTTDQRGEFVAFQAYKGFPPGFTFGIYLARNDEIELVTSANFFGAGPDLHLSDRNGHIALRTSAQLTEFDNAGTWQVYSYSFGDDEISCISCPTSLPKGDAYFSKSRYVAPVADDGRVAFTSPERLAQDDINGKDDVYLSDGGQTMLISSGRGTEAAFLMTMTPDAKDVFFATTDRLVGQDWDVLYDVYTARIGGGLPAQDPAPPTVECQGDGCQLPPPTPPSEQEPASAQATGKGNPEPGNDCTSLRKRAKKVRQEARHLRKKARKADGKRERKLRKRAVRRAERARDLTARARACQGEAR